MIKTLCMLSLAGWLLTGCLSGGGGGGSAGGGGVDGGGGQGTQSFTALVKDIFAGTSETAEPVAINDLTITYDDQENEGAFDDLLSQQ
ncbi:hypothetical protein [Halopseudomonas salina]|uniref:Uncharacterized protein n=1 Tax=Halopseudomonas salina TaxID=1323744 RepID=A0ABQ1P525_9GAMM|nr:hypothetical protein [Halopseudomonas salina]GGC91183.1 hypothetical protein GCM10007418_08560 [Halopseudomonas salina]